MRKIPTMTALALLGGALYVGTRVGRRLANAERLAAARPPDRDVVELPRLHRERLDRYQDLLDESLSLTFPASDPICAHAATRCGDPVETRADPADWRLHPGSSQDARSPSAGR